MLFKLPLANEVYDLLISLAYLLTSSVNGINNLIKTYNSYPMIVSSLDGITHDYVIPIIKKIKNHIPDDCDTPDFLKSIPAVDGIQIHRPDIKHDDPIGTPLSEIVTYK